MIHVQFLMNPHRDYVFWLQVFARITYPDVEREKTTAGKTTSLISYNCSQWQRYSWTGNSISIIDIIFRVP